MATVSFPLEKVSRVVRLLETESGMVVVGAEGRGESFNGHQGSVL